MSASFARCICFVLAIKVGKMIKGGCEAYLSYVIDCQKVDKPSIEAFLVVCEFKDVFPKELSGLTPMWEVDFIIELIMRMVPILIPPYRMTPIELA